mgnify:CR=1 FL=1
MRKAGAVLALGLCSFLVFLVIGYQHTVKIQEEQQAAKALFQKYFADLP